MNEEDKEFKTKQLLQGKENYLPWSKRTTLKLLKLKFINRRTEENGEIKTEWTIDENQLLHATSLILDSVCDDINCTIDVFDSPARILEKLNQSYGFRHVDVGELKSQLRTMHFQPNIEPAIVFAKFDKQRELLVAAGGNLTEEEEVGMFVDGLKHSFWYNCRSTIRETGISTFNSSTIRLKIAKYWVAWGGAEITKESKLQANQATWIPRKCEKCKTERPTVKTNDGKRFLYETHNTINCRVNKDRSQYRSSSLKALDTGANRHFWQSKPDDVQPINSQVYAAGGSTHAVVGVGSSQIGNLKLDNVYHVPEFTHDLVSATTLLKEGKDIILSNNGFEVLDGGIKLAEGKLDKETGLLLFDDATHEKPIESNLAAMVSLETNDQNFHEKLHMDWGHINIQTICKTLNIKAPKDFFCSICATTKMNHPSVKNHQKTEHGNLDVVELDLQFTNAKARDGTSINIKAIDVGSGFLMMRSLKSKESVETANFLKLIKSLLETQTTKVIKNIRTDDGTEFRGHFEAFLNENGMIHQIGDAYDHHFPPHVERSHQTIFKWTLANLKSSNLPKEYYYDAMEYSVYLFNRIVHNNNSKSPYEKLLNKKPKTTHFKKFGCVCTVFIPQEKRETDLDDRGVLGRLIGYCDDFDLVEKSGFKILLEDGRVVHSNSVMFHDSKPMTKLLDLEEKYDLTIISDPDYVENDLDESSMNHTNSISDNSNSTDPVTIDQELPISSRLRSKGLLVDTEVQNSLLLEHSPVTPNEPEPKRVKVDLDHDVEMDHPSKFVNTGEDAEMFMQAFMANLDNTPATYKEAMSSEEKELWIPSMECEMKSMDENDVFDYLTPCPQDIKPIDTKWIYKKKYNADGKCERFKSRLVAKGYTQKYGVDFMDTYAPTLKFKSFRTILSVAASKNLTIHQDDVPTAFLKGTIKENIWIKLPDGKVVKLKKTLYGLKQSPMEWNNTLNQFMIDEGFTRSQADKCIYSRKDGDEYIYVAVYVDDIITAGNNTEEFRQRLHTHFKMPDSDLLQWYLGIQIIQKNGEIEINQNQYVKSKLQEFANHIGDGVASTPLPANVQELLINDSTEVDKIFPYRSMVGSLMYAMLGTRVDLAFALSTVCRHLENPTKLHCTLVQQIYKYLRNNQYSLKYKAGSGKLIGYCDASYGNQIDYKSTTGYLLLHGSNIISWHSSKQGCYAHSAAEAEYVGLNGYIKELIWQQQLMTDIGEPQNDTLTMEDNTSAIAMAVNPQENHKRTKHIQIAFHSTRDYVKNKVLRLQYIPTKEQAADCLTKSLNGVILRYQMNLLGLVKTDADSGGNQMESTSSSQLSSQ